MFTAGQAPVTFRCRPRWWSIFPFSAPSARRWPALLPSLSAFPRLRGVGWGLSSLAASAALRRLFCGPFSSLLLMLSSRRLRRRVLAFSFLLFVSLLPSGSQDLSFALFFSPPYGSLYWVRPILMYVFDFLFLFIVLGASIGRYRRREGYRLRRNTVQPVWMGDAGGAVNIILERGWVKKERVGNRTDLAEGVREKRGTRGEGGPHEGCGKHYFNGLPWCVGCRGGLWWKSGVP